MGEKQGSEQKRRFPAHQPAVETFNRSVIIFLTVCAAQRNPIFAEERVHNILLNAWKSADQWCVGRYVIMPDHIHLFCSPAVREYPALKEWVRYWKSLTARLLVEFGAGGTAPSRTIWQRDFWDTQLRTHESYSEKWEYVRRNPVRAGLVTHPDQWPFQGEIHSLRW